MNREILGRATVAIWACCLACLSNAGVGPASEADAVAQIINGSFELRKSGKPPNHIETLKPGSDDIVGWVKRVVFQASKASTSLTFLDTRPNVHSAGVALDNVVIRRLGQHTERSDQDTGGKQCPGRGGGEITPGDISGIGPRTAAVEERWSKAVGGLVMRLQASQDTFSLGDDVKIVILIKNVTDKTIQTWAHREATFDSYPATSFVVGTPQGRQVVLGRYEFNSNELRFPPKVLLEPGQTTRHTVTLSEWSIGFFGPSSFKTAGKYTIRCIFCLSPFGDPFGFPTEEEGLKEKRARLESPPIAVTLVAKDAATVSSVDRVKSPERFSGLGVFLEDTIMAPAAPRKRPDEDALALEVEYQEQNHLLAEPILVRCSLVNYGAEPIALAYGGRYEQASCIFFDIVGGDGKPIPWVSAEEEDSPGPQPLTIPSGKRLVEWYNLVDHYALTRPGEYKVNVRFESDGKSFNPSTLQTRSDLWKGKIEQKLGALTITEPARPVDKTALKAIRGRATNAIDSPFHFVYVFSAADIPDKFDDFLNQHGDSRYAAYARYGNALAALHRVQRGTPSYAKAAIGNLEAIDATNYPALFAERRLFHLVQAHVAADSSTEQITSLYQRLLADYPHSPFLSLLKSGGQSENAKRE